MGCGTDCAKSMGENDRVRTIECRWVNRPRALVMAYGVRFVVRCADSGKSSQNTTRHIQHVRGDVLSVGFWDNFRGRKEAFKNRHPAYPFP